jgi:hypothetical protein
VFPRAASERCGTLGSMWLYFVVAAGIVAAISVPVVAGTRVLALSLSGVDGERSSDELEPELVARLQQFVAS